ncbi:hypothetical protein [Salinarimonas soli]|uniref:Flagellar protein FlgN n=1 Tax=Salinarimonas soli TaxID=1638099 RepID=A0A5B2V8E0_9HYPH|nr:hypothetical protein [Salinarimonas soli]KAA2234720.1 hypothetical protein F0L46_23435 [Salinarimonas soli]
MTAHTAPADPAAEASAADAPHPDVVAMLAAIERLEDLLDHETRGLGRLSLEELKDVNRRKSLCLLDFMRAARSLNEHAVTDHLRDRIRALRDAIGRNATVLQTHLDAVREIAGTISQSLHERESDGTYSEATSFRGAMR